MSQTWNVPVSNSDAEATAFTKVSDALASLRSMFSGTTAPTSTVAGMLYYNTSDKCVYQRNSADSAWVRVFAAGENNAVLCGGDDWGAVSATTTKFLPCPKTGLYVQDVALVSDLATAGSSAGATEWQFALTKKTGGGTTQLFSGTVGTGTSLGGVGGGAEVAAYTAYKLTANQNQSLAADDVLQLTLTKVGSPTNFTRLSVYLRGYILAP